MMLDSFIAECSDYDFKEKLEIKKPKSWLKSVFAFANGVGGSLFFGISEDRRVTNIEDSQYELEKISELIQELIRFNIMKSHHIKSFLKAKRKLTLF